MFKKIVNFVKFSIIIVSPHIVIKLHYKYFPRVVNKNKFKSININFIYK
jgi:hypothetical protein